MAETSRGEAEKLIVYLLDDFYLELEPVGRLDIVAELAKRALDYYGALPPELRTAETNRNRALALVRYGAVLRNQSKLDESQKALSEAVAVLSKMRQEGDESESTAIGLGVGLMSEARVTNSLGKIADSQQLATQAVDVLKPLMSAAPSIPLRRCLWRSDALPWLCATAERERGNGGQDPGRGARNLPQHRRPHAAGFASAAAFAEATSRQVAALQSLGRSYERGASARKERKWPVSAGAASRPYGGDPLPALISNSLADSEQDILHLRRALALYDEGERDWEAILKIDPSNQIAWNNLANARLSKAWVLHAEAQRLHDAHPSSIEEAPDKVCVPGAHRAPVRLPRA